MFNLTRQERQVILFLSTMALLGLGINFLAKKYSQSKVFRHFYQDIGKVDINHADKEMLKSIPGIGEKLAQRIIAYRQEQAGFKSIEELKGIKGITSYRYEKIKDSLMVR